MLSKSTDTSSKTDKQEEKLTKLSSKLSNDEDHMYKVIINRMHQLFPLQVNNEQDEKLYIFHPKSQLMKTA